MSAVAITLAAFTCWGIVGYALTSTFLARRRALSNLLLSPAVGMGTLELAGHIGLRLNSPTGPIAHGIVGGALAFACAILLIRRPPFPLRRYLPFALILLVAIPLTGWPMFRWGGDWIANANGDMGNYCLASTGYRDHGYRNLPVEQYLAGDDMSYKLWSLYGDCIGHRHGSEMSLSMTSAIVGIPVPFLFMPIILAMHLVLISSVGFLFYRLSDGRTVAGIACAFMALSPLSTFGVVQQLIAQVGGLGILVAAVGLFFRPASKLPTLSWIKRGLLGGIVAASLMLHYTESSSFLVAGFGLHVCIGFARGRRDFKQIAIALMALALTVPLIGRFLISNVGFLILQSQLGGNADPALTAIFPQYLNAEGFARLWGFATLYDPVTVRENSPWPVHRLVVAGCFYLMLSLAAGIALAWRRQPIGAMLLVVVGVAVAFVRAPAAFGLFKLAMYAQPFIIGSIVLGWSRMQGGIWKRVGLLCLLALVPLQYSTQRKYVALSATYPTSGGATPGATRERLLDQYWQGLQLPEAKRLIVPVNDTVSWMLVASCGRGKTLCMPYSIFEMEKAFGGLIGEKKFGFTTEVLSSEQAQTYERLKCTHSIALHDPAKPDAASEFMWNTPEWIDRPSKGDYLLEPPQNYALFNRFHRSPASRSCRALPLTDVGNYIFWRQSSQSCSFNYRLDHSAGLWDLQYDPAFPQETFSAAGRYITLQILNPSPKVRLLVSGTCCYMPGEMDLPPIAAVGNERVPLACVGQGAARVASPPFVVQTIGTSKFCVLDLGASAARNAPNTPGPWDYRQISFYLRDVSLLSEEDYAALIPPECMQSFPADLALKNAEFSGCLEDGSIGKSSWFRLSRPRMDAPLIVRGGLSRMASEPFEKNELVLKWNGVELGRKTVDSDLFEFRVSMPEGEKIGKLELEFAAARCIAPGSRKVSAQLKFVGFEK